MGEREIGRAEGLEQAARECEQGAVGPGVLFEWEGTLYALGENGVAALKYMAAQFRRAAVSPPAAPDDGGRER